MLATYARVLAVPGALLFSLTGLVARIPISTVSLGIVLLVQSSSGSYGLAGTVAGVYVLANAALAIVHGRLADRVGQAAALRPAIVVFALGALGVVLAVGTDQPVWVVYAAAAVTGGALPQVGSCVRARWVHALRGDARGVQTAFAFEAVVDEAVFVAGPVMVTVLATTLHPAAGLGVAVCLGLVGTLALTAQRATQPPVGAALREASAPSAEPGDGATKSETGGRRPRLPMASLAGLTVVCAGLGIVFGATEVATVAFAQERDADVWAGPLLALWAAGSLAAGLAFGAIRWQRGPETRVRWGALALTVAMAPLVLAPGLVVLGAGLLVAGAAISPTLISSLAMIERVTPRERLTEALAVLHTGMAAGVAPGAAIAGFAVDHRGAAAAYLVPIAAGLLATAAAWLTPSGTSLHAAPDPATTTPGIDDLADDLADDPR